MMKDFENIENIEELDLLEIDSETYESVLESVSREYDSDFVRLNDFYEQDSLSRQEPKAKQSFLERKMYKNLSEGIIGYTNDDIPFFEISSFDGKETHLITNTDNSDNQDSQDSQNSQEENKQAQQSTTSTILGLVNILKGVNKDNKDVLELLENIERNFTISKDDLFILDIVFNIIEQIELLEYVDNSQALQSMMKEYIGYVIDLLRYVYDLDKLEDDKKKLIEEYLNSEQKLSAENLSILNKEYKKIEAISYNTKEKKVNSLLEYIEICVDSIKKDLSLIMNDVPNFINEYTKNILSLWNGEEPIYEIQDEILYSFPNYRIIFYQLREKSGNAKEDYVAINHKISSKRSEYKNLLNEYEIPYYTFNLIGSVSDNIETYLDESGLVNVLNQSIESKDEAQFAKNMLYAICMLASHNYNLLKLSYDDIKQTIKLLEAYFNEYVNKEYSFHMFYKGLFNRFFRENNRGEKPFRNFKELVEVSDFSALEVLKDEIKGINDSLSFEDKSQEIASILDKYKKIVRKQEGDEMYLVIKMFINVLDSNSEKKIANFGILRSLIFEGLQNGSVVSESEKDFSFDALFEGEEEGDEKSKALNEGIISWIKSKVGNNSTNSNQDQDSENNDKEDSTLEEEIENLFYVIEEKLGLEYKNEISLGDFLESFEVINDLELSTHKIVGDGVTDIASVECYIPTMPKFYALNILDAYYRHERDYGDVTKVSKLSKLFNDINRDKRSLYDSQNDNQKEIEEGFKALFEADTDNFVANTTPSTSSYSPSIAQEGGVMIPISKYLRNEYLNTDRQGNDVIDFSKIVSDKSDVYNTPLYKKLKEESSPLVEQMTTKVNSYIEQLKGSKVQTWNPATGALNVIGKTITGHDIIDKNASTASKTSKQIEVGSELAKEWDLRKNVIETAVKLYAKTFEETDMYKKGEEFIHYYVERIVQSLLISYNSNQRNLMASYDSLDEMKIDEMAKAYILPDFFQAIKL